MNVTSGTVNIQAEQISQVFSNYDTQKTGLSGSWEGLSYDNLVSKAEEFVSNYQKTITNQMTSFGEACDLYAEYEKEKALLKENEAELVSATRAYNNAKSDKSITNIAKYYYRKEKYENLVEKNTEKKEELKAQIEDKLSSITETLDKGSAHQTVSVKGVVADLDLEQFVGNSNLVVEGDNLMLNCNAKGIVDLFGGQADNHGIYQYDYDGCDNYARGYCLYAQTGKVAESDDVCKDGLGLTEDCYYAENRKDQAQYAYDRLVKDGKPSVIHVNSDSGNGHWITVVGCKKDTTRDSVSIGDLVVIDSAANWGTSNSAGVISCSDKPTYCTEGTDRCYYDNGYQVIYYD